jgi:hypothetical protein
MQSVSTSVSISRGPYNRNKALSLTLPVRRWHGPTTCSNSADECLLLAKSEH